MAENPGIKLLEFIEQKGLTQLEFANKIGIAPSWLNEMIKGKKRIGYNKLSLCC